ncbi:hypothetical protein A6A06_39025 [Streptomyces sp. CB02923]|uniref:DUF6415 family natural product biosynthesis protein n=1 Tax=Streptomyces sp. CB02923 TaxID=1718985 RepID=UPI00093BAFE9|nr:DUF6415 family natural product biosynthesis protein [Streptomyces sp. CB02923]OKI03470.1 hypothetical protein A6A06_39025 [Streptomyces sp. CB02923]
MDAQGYGSPAPSGVDFEAARRTVSAIKARIKVCPAREDTEHLMAEARAILAGLIPLVDAYVRRLPSTSLERDRGRDTIARARTALTWTHTGSSITYLGYVAHVADHLLGYFPDRIPEEG